MRYVAGLIVGGALLLQASSAQAAFFLGDFGYYGILINSGVKNGDINTFPVNANIGVGDTLGKVNLHNGVVNGDVDVSKNAADDLTAYSITGTQPVGRGGPGAATVTSNVTRVDEAIADALALSSLYGGQAASGTALVFGNTMTINASSGFLNATGDRLFKTSNFLIGNSHTVTVNGAASDYVVINVTGTGNQMLDGAFTLTGGITADHVLVNFLGTTAELKGAANGATLSGTFLAPNLKIGLNSLNIDGHVFGGRYNTDFQFVSNALITQPNIPPVPEPATWALLLAGFGLVGGVVRRRRSRALAA